MVSGAVILTEFSKCRVPYHLFTSAIIAVTGEVGSPRSHEECSCGGLTFSECNIVQGSSELRQFRPLICVSERSQCFLLYPLGNITLR